MPVKSRMEPTLIKCQKKVSALRATRRICRLFHATSVFLENSISAVVSYPLRNCFLRWLRTEKCKTGKRQKEKGKGCKVGQANYYNTILSFFLTLPAYFKTCHPHRKKLQKRTLEEWRTVLSRPSNFLGQKKMSLRPVAYIIGVEWKSFKRLWGKRHSVFKWNIDFSWW
jgi:hypothetical protein